MVATWRVADGQTLMALKVMRRVGDDPARCQHVKWPDSLAVRPKPRQICLCAVIGSGMTVGRMQTSHHIFWKDRHAEQ